MTLVVVVVVVVVRVRVESLVFTVRRIQKVNV